MKNTGNRTKWIRLAYLLTVWLLAALTVCASEETRLSKTSLSLLKGKQAALKLTGADGKVSWSSQDSRVASVNGSGKVKGLRKGSTVITAEAGGKTYSCKVTVKQPVTSIVLLQRNIQISEGKSCQLRATVKPASANNRKLKWSSSNKKIVKVSSSGKITAVKAGAATVTAKAKDGSGKKAVCKIMVKKPVSESPVYTVTLNQSNLELKEGETGTLTATTSDNTFVTWGTSDNTVASVLDGTVTAKKAGTAMIAARRLDGKKTAFCKVTVTEETPLPKGVSENAKKFLRILQKYSDRVASDQDSDVIWAYSNSGAPSTWKSALNVLETKGIAYCNCALLPRWALREMGVIDSKNFWGLIGGGIQFRGDVKEQLLKYCDIIKVYKTPDQLLAEGNLLPGDICTWVDYQHTNVYAGDGLWYDAGRSGAVGGYSNGKFVFRSFGPAATVNMAGTTMGHIIRFR